MRYHSTTGLDDDLTEELVSRIAQVTPPRKGRRPIMGLYRSVQLTLTLLRTNITQALAAELFDVSQPTVSRTVRRIVPLIGQVTCLHTPPLPEALHGRLVLVDGTFIPTGRRAGMKKQNFSGKHRRQGVSVQVLSDTDGCLLAVSPPCPGRINDYTALRQPGWETLLEDTAVLGDPAYRGSKVIMPARRAHGGGEHSPTDEQANREHSAIRAAVEHAIAHLKQWKILATGYRGRLTELPAILRIITTLEYFRLGW